METEFVSYQFSMSTAEDERNYFTGTQPSVEFRIVPKQLLPDGTYRVIDGELCLLVRGVPADL